jgi:D-glycero-alpha-D-manno-heptose-7-phosphate kinase
MRAALEQADWDSAGRLLREEWNHRRKNVPGITTPLIDELITAARKAGSQGAKVCGAGGGGCVFFLTERGARQSVADAIHRIGGAVLDAKVATRGVRLAVSQ